MLECVSLGVCSYLCNPECCGQSKCQSRLSALVPVLSQSCYGEDAGGGGHGGRYGRGGGSQDGPEVSDWGLGNWNHHQKRKSGGRFGGKGGGLF